MTRVNAYTIHAMWTGLESNLLLRAERLIENKLPKNAQSFLECGQEVLQ
jgi:hypothetical protein